jgi:serine/threonine protein kinase
MISVCGNKLTNNIKCGIHGCVVVLVEDDTHKIFAGKIEMDPSVPSLENEYNILKKLQESEYIVQLKKNVDGSIEKLCDFTPDHDVLLDHRTLKKENVYKMMIMEFIQDSTDLRDYTFYHKLSDDQYDSIFLQVLKAVKFCHSKDVFILDLKLDNILVYKEIEIKIKLIDFGTSVYRNNKSQNSKDDTDKIRILLEQILKMKYKGDVSKCSHDELLVLNDPHLTIQNMIEIIEGNVDIIYI